MTSMAKALELPYELTSKIFINCLPLRRRLVAIGGPSPLLLLPSFLYLELSCGSTSFDGIPTLFGENNPDLVEEHTATLLDLWFTRAAGHALSIILICSRGTSLDPKTLNVLSSHANHWGRVELAITESDFLQFNQIVGPFPLLQSLSLQITDNPSLFPHRISALERSPNLRALQLRDQQSRLLSSPTTLAESPHTLTALQALAWMFAKFPRLRHFHCAIYTWPVTGPRLIQPLTSLVVSHNVALEFLDLPILEYLQVSLRDDRPSKHFIGFLARSGSRLTHLSLDLEYMTSGGFSRCLSALPVLPELTTLELRRPAPHAGVDACQENRYAAFIALVHAWSPLMRAELRLWSKHVDIRRCMPPPSNHIVAELATLSAQGLTVLVVTPN
ncbi:hypothetical protein B0H16DRAFT_1733981 [Mycena metata]|uniref:F-box domain-containing protein n=1 Tax=Mycena metata TaxID=1033252 RepID=A0AAD7HWH2_9AGAR|nr:hypothetical protein B0H16DRAFT_1733981 [Mycena metata]